MTKKWTEEAWSGASGIYARIIGHPFIKELAAGTLDSAAFNRYVAQDEIYLGNYGRQMLMFASMIADAGQREMFNEFARAGLEGESAMHKLMIERFGTDLEVSASPVTAAYNAHTEAALNTRRPELALAALLPCIWVYNEVGRYIISIAKVDGNPYKEWIAEYANDEFTEGVKAVLELADNYAAAADSDIRQQMTSLFIEATQFEYDFWDYAYGPAI